MKAWNVFPGNDPFDEGCVLVFAQKKNTAKMLAFNFGPWPGMNYVDLKARRAPDFDQYHGKVHPSVPVVESNSELPTGVKFFTDIY